MKINYKRTSKVFAITLTLALLIVTTVYAAWNPSVTVATVFDPMNPPSMAVVNGNPAIIYLDLGEGLRYVRASDVNGGAWGSPVTVDSQSSAGWDSSLAVVDGNPAISYLNPSDTDLVYVRANDADGATWGTPVVAVDVYGDHTSLAVVNGNPAISYNASGLEYVRANDVTGSTWGTPVTVDGSHYSAGEYTSLVVVNGHPAISYYDGNTDDLKYVRANDASGTTWGAPVTLDSTGDVGKYTSLAVVDGRPAISYYDTTNGNLKYVWAKDASGTDWNEPVTVDSTGDVGQYTSLAVVDGNPAISYYDRTNENLKYVRASDASGTTWGSPGPVSLDSMGAVGTSLAVVNGNPAISFFDSGDMADLKFIRAGDTGPQLALTKSVNPSSAKPGQTITYTIAFSNTGAITATNVVITDTMPVSVTNTSFSSSGVTLTQAPGSRYVWTAPDLAQGQGGIITITGVLTKPLAAGTIPNIVTMAISGTVKTANVDLTVENVAPVADAGVDRSKVVSQTVTLDGSGSSDDNGDTLIYGWTQTGGSPTVALSDPTAQQPTFTAPGAATVLTFTLTVTDTGALVDTHSRSHHQLGWHALTVTDTGDLTGTDEVVVTVVEGYIYYFPIMFKNGAP